MSRLEARLVHSAKPPTWCAATGPDKFAAVVWPACREFYQPERGTMRGGEMSKSWGADGRLARASLRRSRMRNPQAPPATVVDVFGDRAALATRYAEILTSAGVERGLLGPRE